MRARATAAAGVHGGGDDNGGPFPGGQGDAGTGGGSGSVTLGQAGILNSVDIQTGGANYAGPTGVVDAPLQNTYTADGTWTDANSQSQPIINTTNNTVHIDNHSFETGMACTLDSQTLDGTAVAPTGLAHNGSYFAIRVGKDELAKETSSGKANKDTRKNTNKDKTHS